MFLHTASPHIAGPAAEALASLSDTQVQFLQTLPKAELHAHLNGCIPLNVLEELASHHRDRGAVEDESIEATIRELSAGATLAKIDDFFSLFPAIYALTSSPIPLAKATAGVISSFLGPPPSNPQQGDQGVYLELRTTPRHRPSFSGSRLEYLETVLSVMELYSASQCALIVSIDRRMSVADVEECVDSALLLKEQGRRVVGIDLCGSPLAGDMNLFKPHFQRAKEHGLKITLHIAETPDNTAVDTQTLLDFLPDRLGHATFLDEDARNVVLERNLPIELCLSSNILCKTVLTLQDHHIRFYLQHKHPISICTDDTLPFRNSLLAEYALLLAAPPLGLGLTEDEVSTIAKMGMEARFS